MKYRTGVSAEWIRIIGAQFGCQVLGTPRLTALKVFPENVFSSDHNNNMKWAILGTKL
jgi:poly-gamma-glutamate capsule biosynthesis protein CapA/YwtB (metallophosphatase superfamily)